MISQEQIAELNKLISEIAAIYSEKVKSIVEQSENRENPVFNLDDLFELKKIRRQLHLLFKIRDNCQQVLYDLELLRNSFCLLD
jgi:hypothetical protein